MKNVNTEELQKALGAFIIALGASMPQELASKIADNLNRLSQQMIAHNDSPNVAMLCEGYAQAILEPHAKPEDSELH